jgi:Ca2+-binding EF-hand superfamily protein
MRTNVLLAALTLAIATTAFAADTTVPPDRVEKAGAKMREKFEAADTDHDGLLSRDETAKGFPHLTKHFDEIDANHDGKLSMVEIAQFLRNKRAVRDETP